MKAITHIHTQMKSTSSEKKYIAFLRGINVGGHHKVPMAQLKEIFSGLGYVNIRTILNSGNIIFELPENQNNVIVQTLEKALFDVLGFSVPVICIGANAFKGMMKLQPFKNELLTKNTRWYVSFLKNTPAAYPELPWVSGDGSFRVVHATHSAVFSVLNLDVVQTPKGMEMLEKMFGKEITTRNWNTLDKLETYC